MIRVAVICRDECVHMLLKAVQVLVTAKLPGPVAGARVALGVARRRAFEDHVNVSAMRFGHGRGIVRRIAGLDQVKLT